MSKLSLEALKMRAEAIASEELLNSISGGTENACHNSIPQEPVPTQPKDNIPSGTVKGGTLTLSPPGN